MTEDILEIKEKFDKIITYSQGIPEPKTDKLFEIWQEKKSKFFTLFEKYGDKYIYEYPVKVSFDLSEEEKHERISYFCSVVEEKWQSADLAEFIEKQETGFFRNVTVEDYVAPNGKIVRKGEKLVKSFKNFIKNKKCLTDIQNEASRIIQENKVEGRLCFSVHPLDYLSLSENVHNWRTCHSLDGDYRAGNLSYMMDSCTIVTYLKAEEDTKLPNFPEDIPWNSKKWRVLLYLSEDNAMVFAGKPYPFVNQGGLNLIIDILKTITLSDWIGWQGGFDSVVFEGDKTVYFSYPGIIINDRVLPIDELVKDGKGSKHFNDVLRSSSYSPVYSFAYYESSPKTTPRENEIIPITSILSTKFEIGGFTYCLWCGEAEALYGESTMMCGECELEYGAADSDNIVYCDCCNRRVFFDDVNIVGEDYVCDQCLDYLCGKCDCCDSYVYETDLIFIEETEEYVCKYCLDGGYY